MCKSREDRINPEDFFPTACLYLFLHLIRASVWHDMRMRNVRFLVLATVRLDAKESVYINLVTLYATQFSHMMLRPYFLRNGRVHDLHDGYTYRPQTLLSPLFSQI